MITRLCVSGGAPMGAPVSAYVSTLTPPSGRVGCRQTALHRAALRGSSAIVQLLLLHGADPDTRTADGCVTPLHLAAENSAVATAAVLLGCERTYGERRHCPRFAADCVRLHSRVLCVRLQTRVFLRTAESRNHA